jgi:two-component system response regulator HydG
MAAEFRTPSERLLRLWNLVLEEVPADCGLLMLLDEGGAVALRLSHGLSQRGEGENAWTFIRRTLADHQPLCLARAPAEHFLREDGLVGFRQRGSALCVPLIRQGRAAGALYLGRGPETGSFSSDDLEFLLSLARPILNSAPGTNGRPKGGSHSSASKGTDLIEGRIVGRSPAICQVRDLIRKVGHTDAAVFITGESGTGKELIAKSIHEASRCLAGPFVAVNCGALPDTLLESELFGHVRGAFTGAVRDKRGLIEEAEGGTFFLDEIGDLPLALQAKLLRAIQEKEVRRVGDNHGRRVAVRFVSATNKDIWGEVGCGRFREDLYYRLRVIPVDVPPLRDRMEDFLPLVDACLESCCAELGRERAFFSTEALEVMMAYPWPGNVRELQNETQRCLVLLPRDSCLIAAEHLSAAITRTAQDSPRPGHNYFQARAEFEKRFLTEELALFGFNQSRTAERIGLSRQGLFKLLRKHKIAAIRPARKARTTSSAGPHAERRSAPD